MPISVARCIVTNPSSTIALRKQSLEPLMAPAVETRNGAWRENVSMTQMHQKLKVILSLILSEQDRPTIVGKSTKRHFILVFRPEPYSVRSGNIV